MKPQINGIVKEELTKLQPYLRMCNVTVMTDVINSISDRVVGLDRSVTTEEIIQIKTFTPDIDYVADGDLPFDKKVVKLSAQDKINIFLRESMATKVHDISHLEHQGDLEWTVVYSIRLPQPPVSK